MEMSFAKQLKESGIFKGMVLPGGFDSALKKQKLFKDGSLVSCMDFFPELVYRHLAFQPRTCVLCPAAENVYSGGLPVAAGTWLSLLVVSGGWVV